MMDRRVSLKQGTELHNERTGTLINHEEILFSVTVLTLSPNTVFWNTVSENAWARREGKG